MRKIPLKNQAQDPINRVAILKRTIRDMEEQNFGKGILEVYKLQLKKLQEKTK